PRHSGGAWLVDEKPLHEMYAERLHHVVFFLSLDTLGDHHRAVLVGKSHHRLDQVLLDEVLIDAIDQRHIELDEIRLEVGNRAKSGVTAAGVVDGESISLVAELLEATAEFRVVLDGRALGDLDYHAGRILDVER